MSDKDKSTADSAAPKRRGRRPKLTAPAANDWSEPTTTEAPAPTAARGRGRRPSRAAAPEAPPAPEPKADSPGEQVPMTFSTSDDDLRDQPRGRDREPELQDQRESNEPAPSSEPPPSEGSAAPAGQDNGGAPGPNGPVPQRGGPPDRGNFNQNRGPQQRPWENKPWRNNNDRFNRDRDFKKGKFNKPYPPQGGGANRPPFKPPFAANKPRPWQGPPVATDADTGNLNLGELPFWEALSRLEDMERMTEEVFKHTDEGLDFNRLYTLGLRELEAEARGAGIAVPPVPIRRHLVRDLMRDARAHERPVRLTGVLELLEENHGILVYTPDNFRIRAHSCFVPQRLMDRWGLRRGHEVEVWAHAPRDNESCPFALKIITVNGRPPEDVAQIIPFTELVPYYPTERFLLETGPDAKWDNNSMRVVDLLTPIGLGQRGLIVAPPRTGKTVLMQGIANSIRANRPDIHMIILLVDERPEEVTDFRRTVQGAEVISSTFDEPAESHVHAAEMVIEKARRMIEYGRHVVILLDSITRLARAYNTLMPSSGKILSGGVEASALQKPKRFFGSARNIEGGGSLTILGTALIETGSKMDEVIFEEFKGTGNMELDLDRALSDKRIFPSMSFEKSGTRKEELLYHPDELQKIYSLRRAMKGVPSTEAMEMLIQRVKKTKSNAEFLMSLSR